MVRRKVLLGSGEIQENHSENTPPSGKGEDLHVSERISKSSAQSLYVKMDDLERLLEEAVRRGTEVALWGGGRCRWGPRNQVLREPHPGERKDPDSIGSSRAPSSEGNLNKECFGDNLDVDELRREVAELKATIKPPANFARGNPFSKDILNELVPPGTRGGYGGFTRSARKRHVRELVSGCIMGIQPERNSQEPAIPLTFTNEDRKGIMFPHEDALVISAIISNVEKNPYPLKRKPRYSTSCRRIVTY
ncbi:hypothetical protein Salat_0869100 [Sesamum alatum]|uniref:Uncharacterized protein n=1 Tax=Sesamum alatum TaxID=300844 RepID=A0AAE1YJR4_9LAMI|nr:hypothetical protein Salat_0869100 [Sesamum alatum]